MWFSRQRGCDSKNYFFVFTHNYRGSEVKYSNLNKSIMIYLLYGHATVLLPFTMQYCSYAAAMHSLVWNSSTG